MVVRKRPELPNPDGLFTFYDMSCEVIDLILERLTFKEKIRLERVDTGFGIRVSRLVKKITDDDLDPMENYHADHASQERTYLALIRRLKNVQIMDIDKLALTDMLAQVLRKKTTVNKYVQTVADHVWDCSEWNFYLWEGDLKKLYILELLAKKLNQKKANYLTKMSIQFSFYRVTDLPLAMDKLMVLLNHCQNVTEFDLMFYSSNPPENHYDEESKAKLDVFWTHLSGRATKLKVDFNDGHIGPFYGSPEKGHYLVNPFVNLTEFVSLKNLIEDKYIKSLCESSKKLKILKIVSPSMDNLKSVSNLLELTELSFNYFAIESRITRDANQVIFEKFLDNCGSNLDKLELKIPFQRSDFFNSVQMKCSNLEQTVIKLRGTPNFFSGTELANVPKLRKLNLDLKVNESQLRNLLNTCDKLRSLKFDYVEYDLEKVKLQLKPLVIDYSKKNPQRPINVYVRKHDLSYARRHDDTMDGMVRFKIELK